MLRCDNLPAFLLSGMEAIMMLDSPILMYLISLSSAATFIFTVACNFLDVRQEFICTPEIVKIM